jgi:hypothetical protein
MKQIHPAPIDLALLVGSTAIIAGTMLGGMIARLMQ